MRHIFEKVEIPAPYRWNSWKCIYILESQKTVVNRPFLIAEWISTATVEVYRKSILIRYLRRSWNSYSLWLKINILLKNAQKSKISKFVTLQTYWKSILINYFCKSWNSYSLNLLVKINILLEKVTRKQMVKIWKF